MTTQCLLDIYGCLVVYCHCLSAFLFVLLFVIALLNNSRETEFSICTKQS